MTSTTFGIAIPQIWAQPDEGLVSLQPFLARAEALGFHSAWVQEQVLGTANSLEPVALLSYAAATTRRMRLGTAVIITTLRNPVRLAKSLATVDHLSDGRLIVGVGIGGLLDLYPAFGISSEARVRRFTDGIRTTKRLWTEDRVDPGRRLLEARERGDEAEARPEASSAHLVWRSDTRRHPPGRGTR